MTERLGRADLHIHTLASDGTAGIVEILAHVQRATDLDVIAITDHERIDAAAAARTMASDGGLPVHVIVGEEVTTRGGHLLGLFLTEAVPPLRSLRESIARIHDQGGLAIPAHPLVPYPLCAQGGPLRRLVNDPDPRYRPDGLEAFNPTPLGRPRHERVVEFTAELGLAAIGSSDAHTAAAIGQGWTTFPGRTAEDLRDAILARTTHWHGSFHATAPQIGVFGRQLRKYGRDARADSRAGSCGPARVAITDTPAAIAARPRSTGTRLAARFDGRPERPKDEDEAGPGAAARAGCGPAAAMKIGLVSPYVYPLPGGVTQHVQHLYANLRLRGHDVRIITSSHGLQKSSEGDVIRIGKGFSMPANGSVGTITVSPRYMSQVREVLDRERFDLLHFHEPLVPFLSPIVLREFTQREHRDVPCVRRLLTRV